MLETFIKIFGANPHLVTIGEKILGSLHEDLRMFFCCWWCKITVKALLTETFRTVVQRKAMLCLDGSVFIIDYIVALAFLVHRFSLYLTENVVYFR